MSSSARSRAAASCWWTRSGSSPETTRGAQPYPSKSASSSRLGNAGEHGRVRDLPAVQVQDREDGAVPRRVEELVRVPARRHRPGLGLAVADDAGDEKLRVVEGRAEGVRERVSELAALVDRPRRLGRDVAGDAAGEGELAEQPPQALRVLGDALVELAVGALEVRVGDQARPAVARPGDEEDAEVARPDGPVQVGVEQVQPRRRAEVPEQARLHVLGPERLPEERVVEQVDLPDGQVVRRAPVGVEEAELLDGKGARGRRTRGHRRTSISPRARALRADLSKLAACWSVRAAARRTRTDSGSAASAAPSSSRPRPRARCGRRSRSSSPTSRARRASPSGSTPRPCARSCPCTSPR